MKVKTKAVSRLSNDSTQPAYSKITWHFKNSPICETFAQVVLFRELSIPAGLQFYNLLDSLPERITLIYWLGYIHLL